MINEIHALDARIPRALPRLKKSARSRQTNKTRNRPFAHAYVTLNKTDF
jgi:hypothetical protein